MFKRDDLRGGAERLRQLGEKAERLEERFTGEEDPVGIWAKETKDMLLGVAEGRQRGYATFLDPIQSLLHELLQRGMKKEARPFVRLFFHVIQGLPGSSCDEASEFGFGMTGNNEVQHKKEDQNR